MYTDYLEYSDGWKTTDEDTSTYFTKKVSNKVTNPLIVRLASHGDDPDLYFQLLDKDNRGISSCVIEEISNFCGGVILSGLYVSSAYIKHDFVIPLLLDIIYNMGYTNVYYIATENQEQLKEALCGFGFDAVHSSVNIRTGSVCFTLIKVLREHKTTILEDAKDEEYDEDEDY